jgi:hypothetical protein
LDFLDVTKGRNSRQVEVCNAHSLRCFALVVGVPLYSCWK